jgi:hypothetical protein
VYHVCIYVYHVCIYVCIFLSVVNSPVSFIGLTNSQQKE